MRSALLALLAGFLVVGLIGCGGGDSPEPGKPAPGVAATTGGAPAANGLDLSFVTDDFFAAVVLHPARVLKSPIVAPLLQLGGVSAQMEQLGLQPADIERVMLLLSAPQQPQMGPEMPTIVVRLAQPFDLKKRLTELFEAMMGGLPGPLVEKTVQGKTCYKIDPNMPVIAFALDEQTAVLTVDALAEKMLSPGPKKGPLAQRLGQIELDNDAVAVLTLDPIREMIREGMEQTKGYVPPPLVGLTELPDVLTAGTLSVDLSGDTLLKAVLEAKDDQGATKVEEVLNGLLETAKREFEEDKQAIREEMREQAAPWMALADQGLAGLAVGRDGQLVTVTLKRPEGLNESVTAMLAGAVGAARGAARRSRQLNNLKQIGLAMHTYHDVHKRFPPAASRDPDGKPLLSWRVALLPYLEAEGLHHQFKLDEPWDSPHNLELAKQMPEVFVSVGRENDGKTSIMVFTGEGTAFARPEGSSFADIRDGASNTIMCVEAGPDKDVPWTKPEDLPFDPKNPIAALGNIPETGFLAAFFDGAVQVIPPSIDAETLKALITPRGGEDVDGP